MKEKIHPIKEKTGGSGSFFDQVNGATLVTVASGPYCEALPISGRTVAEVREEFSARFDIDPASTAVINGKDADESMMLAAGVTLMFMNRAGEKGGRLKLAANIVTAPIWFPIMCLHFCLWFGTNAFLNGSLKPTKWRRVFELP